MAEVVLAAETGRPQGSRAARRLRREGKIPGVIYGHGTDPLPVAVGARELRVGPEQRGRGEPAAVPRHRIRDLPDDRTRHATSSGRPDGDPRGLRDRPARRGDQRGRADHPGRRGDRGAARRRPGRAADVHPAHQRAAGGHPDRHRGRHQRADHRRAGPRVGPSAAGGRHDRSRARRPPSRSASRPGSSSRKRLPPKARAVRGGAAEEGAEPTGEAQASESAVRRGLGPAPPLCPVGAPGHPG